jgi:hypothetical protein
MINKYLEDKITDMQRKLQKEIDLGVSWSGSDDDKRQGALDILLWLQHQIKVVENKGSLGVLVLQELTYLQCDQDKLQGKIEILESLFGEF